MKDIRVAAAVCPCPLHACGENLRRVEKLSIKAKAAGASIVLFPEMNLTGYTARPPKGSFGEPVDGNLARSLQGGKSIC